MILVDWWLGPQFIDTVVNLRVFQPTNEIKMVDGSAVRNPVATSALTTELFSWWYELSPFDADDYEWGRIRINTLYSRGWYQNDSNYRASRGDTLFFPDSQTTITYQTMTGLQNTTVALKDTIPKFFVFPESATYRGPKLYLSMGNSGTEILNIRPFDRQGNILPGNLDKCIDSLKSDTVWIRWGTPSAPPGQQPSASKMKCFSQNPFIQPTSSIRNRPGTTRPLNRANLSTDGVLRCLPGGKWDAIGRMPLR